MNPILSVFLKDFLIVPDEVVDSLCRSGSRNLFLLAPIEPEISLDLAAGELSDEVDVTDAGLADEIDEQAVGVELYLTRLRGEG